MLFCKILVVSTVWQPSWKNLLFSIGQHLFLKWYRFRTMCAKFLLPSLLCFQAKPEKRVWSCSICRPSYKKYIILNFCFGWYFCLKCWLQRNMCANFRLTILIVYRGFHAKHKNQGRSGGHVGKNLPSWIFIMGRTFFWNYYYILSLLCAIIVCLYGASTGHRKDSKRSSDNFFFAVLSSISGSKNFRAILVL